MLDFAAAHCLIPVARPPFCQPVARSLRNFLTTVQHFFAFFIQAIDIEQPATALALTQRYPLAALLLILELAWAVVGETVVVWHPLAFTRAALAVFDLLAPQQLAIGKTAF